MSGIEGIQADVTAPFTEMIGDDAHSGYLANCIEQSLMLMRQHLTAQDDVSAIDRKVKSPAGAQRTPSLCGAPA